MENKFIKYLKYPTMVIFIFLTPFSDIAAKLGLFSIYLAFLVKYFIHKKAPITQSFKLKNSLNLGIILFLFSSIISTIFSVNPYHSQKILFGRYFLYLLCFFAGLNFIRSRKELKFFETTFILSGIIVGMGGLVFFLLHSPERLFYSWNVNVDIGLFSVMYIPFVFFYWIGLKKSIMKTFVWLGFCTLTACLLLNSSRGMLISILLGIFITLLFIKKDKKSLISLLLFTLVLIIYILLFNQTRLLDLGTWICRIPYIKEGLKLFKHSPLIGKGLGSFELLNFVNPEIGIHALHIENLYVEILGQSGIIGLASFLFLFWLYFKHIHTNLNNLKIHQLAISASIVSCLISGLFGSVIIVGVPMPFLFWFILGISLSEISQKS